MNINDGINTNYLNNDLIYSMTRHEESERIMSNRYHQLTYRDGLKIFHHCLKNNEIIAEAFNNFLALREENFTQLPFKNVVLINTALDKLEGTLYFSVVQPNNFISHYAYNAQNGQWSTISNSTVFDLSKFKGNNYAFTPREILDDKTNISTISIYGPNVNKIEDFWVKGSLVQTCTNFNKIEVEYEEPNEYVHTKYLGDSYYTSCVKTFCSILKEQLHREDNVTFKNGNIVSLYNPCHTYLLPDDILIYFLFKKNFK